MNELFEEIGNTFHNKFMLFLLLLIYIYYYCIITYRYYLSFLRNFNSVNISSLSVQLFILDSTLLLC